MRDLLCMVGAFWCLMVQAPMAGPSGCDQAQSRKEIQKLSRVGAILSISKFTPYVTVTVTEETWKQFDQESRRTVAFRIDCAILGPADKMVGTVSIRSNVDNRQLAIYTSKPSIERQHPHRFVQATGEQTKEGVRLIGQLIER